VLRNASDRIIGRPNGRANDGYFAQEQRLEGATIVAIRSVVSRVRDSGCEIILPASTIDARRCDAERASPEGHSGCAFLKD
jgi:hypothetical protein